MSINFLLFSPSILEFRFILNATYCLSLSSLFPFYFQTHQSTDHGIQHQSDQQPHVTCDRLDFVHRFLSDSEVFRILAVCWSVRVPAKLNGLMVALVALRHLVRIYARRKRADHSRKTDSDWSAYPAARSPNIFDSLR